MKSGVNSRNSTCLASAPCVDSGGDGPAHNGETHRKRREKSATIEDKTRNAH